MYVVGWACPKIVSGHLQSAGVIIWFFCGAAVLEKDVEAWLFMSHLLLECLQNGHLHVVENSACCF